MGSRELWVLDCALFSLFPTTFIYIYETCCERLAGFPGNTISIKQIVEKERKQNTTIGKRTKTTNVNNKRKSFEDFCSPESKGGDHHRGFYYNKNILKIVFIQDSFSLYMIGNINLWQTKNIYV